MRSSLYYQTALPFSSFMETVLSNSCKTSVFLLATVTTDFFFIVDNGGGLGLVLIISGTLFR